MSAAVTAAAVLATIWMTDSANPLSPSWSPTAAGGRPLRRYRPRGRRGRRSDLLGRRVRV
jgi:hypothetical protein